MTARQRILITGFEPFPGAPYNPTAPLVERLLQLRRPALDGVECAGHVFRVSYGAVDRDLPALLAAHAPSAMLMFGLAQRTPYLRVETRARNRVTRLWPDADHDATRRQAIEPDGPAHLAFGSHTQQLLQATRATGIAARLSHDAGRYLCNYLSWAAIAAARRQAPAPIVAFVHVPLVPRRATTSPRHAIGFEELVDAGEALLMTMVKLARSRALAATAG